MLKGKKTYITAGVAVITAILGYFTGDLSISAAAQAILTAALAATLRNGMA